MQIGEFFATLGIQINQTQWNSAESQVKSFAKNFLSVPAVIAESVVALGLFENSMGRSLTKLGNMSQVLDIPV